MIEPGIRIVLSGAREYAVALERLARALRRGPRRSVRRRVRAAHQRAAEARVRALAVRHPPPRAARSVPYFSVPYFGSLGPAPGEAAFVCPPPTKAERADARDGLRRYLRAAWQRSGAPRGRHR